MPVECRRTDELHLALGAKRVVWRLFEAGNHGYEFVWTGAIGAAPKRLSNHVQDDHITGPFLTDTSGDGATLVYSVVNISLVEGTPCDFHGPSCLYVAEGGSIKRVVGGSSRAIPGVSGAALVAASLGRVALVPVDRTPGPPHRPAPAKDGAVEVRDAASGALISTFVPVGTVRALAFGRSRVAVLVEEATGSKRIERHDAATGALVGSTWVRPEVADELDLAGGRIIYRRGANIMLMDAQSGGARRVAVAASVPRGLSIEGRRIAWAENFGRTHRIRAMVLPS